MLRLSKSLVTTPRPVPPGGLALAAVLFLAPAASAQSDSPSMVAMAGETRIDLPLLHADVDARIAGDLATVTVRQVFENPTDTPVNATYLFPLTKDAAVFAMKMEVGDEIIEAQIQEKAAAKATFEAAKADGKAASLLDQHRPNVFTQAIANLMPDLPVTVTISYVQTVPRVDGAYELVVPMVVGPRYEGPADPAPGPTYPGVAGLNLPETLAAERMAVNVGIDAPVPVRAVWSDTHAIDVTGADTRRAVALAAGRVVDDRDFVLRYSLAADDTAAGLLTNRDDTGTAFSLLIEPPAIAAPAAQPRELVFVLDTSGSMAGVPMDASKAFMRHALGGLRPDDHFRIIRFSDTATAYAATAQPATADAIAHATAFVAGLDAGGGTEIANAIETAFAAPAPQNALRVVVFLSDGYIGNEAGVLNTIGRLIGDSRIYAFGVGTSVNRYLLDEMAQVGRGRVRYIDPTETGLDAARAFAASIDTPVLTDISIDWGTLAPTDVNPARLPDLFAGGALRVQGRTDATGPATIVVSGRADGRTVEMPLTVDLPTANTLGREAITLIWARARIADLMRAMALDPARDAEAEVTRLGLAHRLATRWTSFVAVSRRVVNATPGEAVDADVPLPQVAGVPASAYPSSIAGSSTPEPGMVAGLAVIAAVAGLAVGRQRRSGRRPGAAPGILAARDRRRRLA